MHILHTRVPGGESGVPSSSLDPMTRPTFLDLFSGAGGLSLGLMKAGWRPLLAVDCWSDAVATYRRNLADHTILHTDIQDIRAARLPGLLPEKPTWIVGGPPCQGFSTVGKRLRNDPRNLLMREFHRMVKALRPDGFLIENVLGLKDMRFEGGVIELFDDLGYDVSFHVLRAADYGIPQLRRRVVFVGHRHRASSVGHQQRIPPTST